MIALAIFDHQERKIILDFANDYERLAREVKARDLGVTLPHVPLPTPIEID
jgi:hypothetical protein